MDNKFNNMRIGAVEYIIMLAIRFLNLENTPYILHKYGVYIINLKANNFRHHQSQDFFVTHNLY